MPRSIRESVYPFPRRRVASSQLSNGLGVAGIIAPNSWTTLRSALRIGANAASPKQFTDSRQLMVSLIVALVWERWGRQRSRPRIALVAT